MSDEFPADWTPEKIEQYRLLMEAKWKAQRNTVEIKDASERAAKTKQKAKASDPWEDILLRVEREHVIDPTGAILTAPNTDGKLEWRMMSRFIMASILKIPRERHQHTSQRLGRVMRRIGWQGPYNMKFGAHQAKGYRKTIDEDEMMHLWPSRY